MAFLNKHNLVVSVGTGAQYTSSRWNKLIQCVCVTSAIAQLIFKCSKKKNYGIMGSKLLSSGPQVLGSTGPQVHGSWSSQVHGSWCSQVHRSALLTTSTCRRPQLHLFCPHATSCYSSRSDQISQLRGLRRPTVREVWRSILRLNVVIVSDCALIQNDAYKKWHLYSRTLFVKLRPKQTASRFRQRNKSSK